jgi:hypothetical protein
MKKLIANMLRVLASNLDPNSTALGPNITQASDNAVASSHKFLTKPNINPGLNLPLEEWPLSIKSLKYNYDNKGLLIKIQNDHNLNVIEAYPFIFKLLMTNKEFLSFGIHRSIITYAVHSISTISLHRACIVDNNTLYEEFFKKIASNWITKIHHAEYSYGVDRFHEFHIQCFIADSLKNKNLYIYKDARGLLNMIVKGPKPLAKSYSTKASSAAFNPSSPLSPSIEELGPSLVSPELINLLKNKDLFPSKDKIKNCIKEFESLRSKAKKEDKVLPIGIIPINPDKPLKLKPIAVMDIETVTILSTGQQLPIAISLAHKISKKSDDYKSAFFCITDYAEFKDHLFNLEIEDLGADKYNILLSLIDKM